MFKVTVLILSCALLAAAVPVEKNEKEQEPKKDEVASIQPVILEAFELPSITSEPKPSEESSSTPAAVDSSSVAPGEAALSSETENKPSPTSATFIEIGTPSQQLTPPRRQVLYDQRQDGKYNIRADLENFVVLVVPSSGYSLLDLLRRSNTKSHHHKRNHHSGKHYKKYHGHDTKSGHGQKESSRLDYLRPEPSDLVDTPPAVSQGEFIEGRTPYHVDISSSEILQPTVLPSIARAANIAPLLQSLLVKPVTIADLPLSDDPSSVDDSATVFLPAQLKGNENRQRKSLADDDSNASSNLNSNSVLLTPIHIDKEHAIHGGNGKFNQHNDDVAYDIKRPDFIDLTDTSHSFDSLNVGNIDRLALSSDTKSTDSQWELTLLGAQEQCGPDRRRDSYGICQFVPHDYAVQ